ncbi:MAG: hypothetical protein HOC74_22560 [Gemmatimonadetes bacterium]|nr:hypothetical protein [Gemmatimonadota bacterium]
MSGLLHRALTTLTIALLCLLVLPLPSSAHDGQIATAAPVTGIAIDGDLSDWPEAIERIPLTSEAYPPSEAVWAWFRVGYSQRENALYVAVEIEDDSSAADGDPQATCGVYLELQHREEETPPFAAVAQGEKRQAFLGDLPAPWQHIELEQSSAPGLRRYEWRFDIDGVGASQVQLQPGLSFGLGVKAIDREIVSWGMWYAKFNNQQLERVQGDLILSEGHTGQLHVQTRWTDTREPIRRARIRLDSDQGWLLAAADHQGICRLTLPTGRYRPTQVQFGQLQNTEPITIADRRETRVELSVSPSSSIATPAGPGQGKWQTFGIAEGLIGSTVYALLQDRSGDIWIATETGLSRYNGRKFTSYTREDGLVSNNAVALLEDRNGDIWIGTWFSGLSRYDGHRFVNYSSEEGLDSNAIFKLLEDRNGNIWAGTNQGLYRFDARQNVGQKSVGQRFSAAAADSGFPQERISALLEDRDGNIWIGTLHGPGLYRFEAQQNVGRQNVGQQCTLLFPELAVNALLEDRDGNIWIAAQTGLYRFDAQRNVGQRNVARQLTRFTTEDGLAHNQVTAMLEDAEGALWFGTGSYGLGEGISRYTGNQMTTFTTADGLPHENVGAILEDREGQLWFENGYYDGKAFYHYAEDQSGFPLLQDSRGRVWTSKGYFDGKRFTRIDRSDGNIGFFPQSEDSAGHLWGNAVARIAHFDGEKYIPFTLLQDRNLFWARTLLVDRSDRLWIGTWFNALFRIDGEEIAHFTIDDGLADNGIGALFEDRDGQLWIGTWTGGLSRYDDRRDVGRQDVGDFHNIDQKDGLAANWINAITQDREGRLLIATNGGGVSLYDGLVIQNLTTYDGLASDRVGSLVQDRQGDIWFSTDQGLTRYRPIASTPPICITDLISDRRHGPLANLRLSADQDYVAFAYQGKSFKTRPGHLAYVYRLQGYHDEWRASS